MKRNYLLAALVMGMFLVAGASPAFAEWNAQASPYIYQGEGPDLGQYEFSAPVETGSLPLGEDLSAGKSDIMEKLEAHESGGATFRNGIDDGP
ncbi:MAG: hypothetical protein M0Z38_09855 [Deltaproteobacteria bacterium]|nr:hypothetical protein [Deltaproteobacteria bacterium]